MNAPLEFAAAEMPAAARSNGFGLFRFPYGRRFEAAIALLKRLF